MTHRAEHAVCGDRDEPRVLRRIISGACVVFRVLLIVRVLLNRTALNTNLSLIFERRATILRIFSAVTVFAISLLIFA